MAQLALRQLARNAWKLKQRHESTVKQVQMTEDESEEQVLLNSIEHLSSQLSLSLKQLEPKESSQYGDESLEENRGREKRQHFEDSRVAASALHFRLFDRYLPLFTSSFILILCV